MLLDLGMPSYQTIFYEFCYSHLFWDFTLHIFGRPITSWVFLSCFWGIVRPTLVKGTIWRSQRLPSFSFPLIVHIYTKFLLVSLNEPEYRVFNWAYMILNFLFSISIPRPLDYAAFYVFLAFTYRLDRRWFVPLRDADSSSLPLRKLQRCIRNLHVSFGYMHSDVSLTLTDDFAASIILHSILTRQYLDQQDKIFLSFKFMS